MHLRSRFIKIRVMKTVRAEEKITVMGEKILVVTSSEFPTKKVKEVLGSVAGISKSASTEADFTRAEREAMDAVMRWGCGGRERFIRALHRVRLPEKY